MQGNSSETINRVVGSLSGSSAAAGYKTLSSLQQRTDLLTGEGEGHRRNGRKD
jgi:hypothetical protein